MREKARLFAKRRGSLGTGAFLQRTGAFGMRLIIRRTDPVGRGIRACVKGWQRQQALFPLDGCATFPTGGAPTEGRGAPPPSLPGSQAGVAAR
eukprot:803495-Pyramimonas_sp.AAC.1